MTAIDADVDPSRTYGAELDRLTDALLQLHSADRELRRQELDHVAAFRNTVIEAVTDLVTLVAGGAARRRSLSSVDDLQVAPTGFLSRALRGYPRLVVDEGVSPSDSFSATALSGTAHLWQEAARRALAAAHIACSQARLPTAPGERTPVVADLAAIAQVMAALDGPLAEDFARYGDPRAEDLANASRAPIALVCREVRRLYDSAPSDRSWDSVSMPQLRPMVVRGAGDLHRGTARLLRLLDASRGQLDARGIAAVIQAQARTHFRLHELLAMHVQRGVTTGQRDLVAHSVAHLEMAHLLSDAYRTSARVASPLRGDRRPVTQAAELHRAIAALSFAHPPDPGLLIALARPQLDVIHSIERTVTAGLSQGRLLVPGWDGDSGGTAWTLERRARVAAPLRRQLEAIGERRWSAFAVAEEVPPVVRQTAPVRYRLASLTQ
jgi:hypothetical protein